jgi:DNA uptake protein ComE-like DNA-binding protein
LGSIFRDVFSFSKREKRGIYVLIVLITLLIGIKYFYLPKYETQQTIDPSSFKKDVKAFRQSLKKKSNQNIEFKNKHSKRYSDDKQRKIVKKNLFVFNPNKLSRNGWKKLGLNDNVINVIENYRKSGGKFYEKEDLKKIYGLNKTIYSKLKPYIKIPPRSKDADISYNAGNNKKKKELENHSTVINVNKADTFNLMLVNGIGPTYAKRICKYRELLGGFYKKEQLQEVYGINDTVYSQIYKSLKLDTSEIEKIDLNNTTFKELIRHPYISAYQTKAILKYLEYKDSIDKTEELIDNNILDEKTYDKVNIYLTP